MKNFILLLVLLTNGCILLAHTKNGIVNGKLVDSVYKESLSEATVSLLNPQDSTVVAYALANTKGGFEFRGLMPGKTW